MPRVSVIAMTMNHERFAERPSTASPPRRLVTLSWSSPTTARSMPPPPSWSIGWNGPVARPRSSRHAENRGICPTLVEALSHTSGELLAVVSLDDLWRQDRLARAVDAFDAAGDDVALVYSDCEVIDEHGAVLFPSFMEAYTAFGISGPPPPDGDVFVEMVQSNFICAPAATSRRAAVEAVGGYDERLTLEDWAMWLKLSADNRVAYIDANLGSYRVLDSGYWRQMVRRRAVRQCLFDCLANVFGRRPDVDPFVRMRLRDLVETMASNQDEGTPERAATLSELDPPITIGSSASRTERVEAAATLVKQGYSIVDVSSQQVTLTPRASKILYLAPWLTVGGWTEAPSTGSTTSDATRSSGSWSPPKPVTTRCGPSVRPWPMRRGAFPN